MFPSCCRRLQDYWNKITKIAFVPLTVPCGVNILSWVSSLMFFVLGPHNWVHTQDLFCACLEEGHHNPQFQTWLLCMRVCKVVGTSFVFWYQHRFDAQHVVMQENLQTRSCLRIRGFFFSRWCSQCKHLHQKCELITVLQSDESLVSYISKVFHLHHWP